MSIYFLEQSGEQNSIRPFDLRDQGLLLANGVFDTSLIIGGNMILRTDHVHRLVCDATAMGINLRHQKINNLLDQFLKVNHDGVLRITVTSGPSERWNVDFPKINPTVVFNFSPQISHDHSSPLSLQITSIRRNNTSITSRHKTLAYIDNIIALRSARTLGYDDAVFLNSDRNICCTTTANLFLKFGDSWVTPPISDGVLPGVMRQFIMQIAPSIGLEIRECSIAEDKLKGVTSAFVTNSVRLTTPVSSINAHKLQPILPVGLQHATTKLIKSE